MGLRNILLTISCIIIGLCLSLYFQTGQSTPTMNWDQYKNLEYSEQKSHSLKDFDAKIAPYTLEDIILEIFEKNRLAGEKTRVMEIGPGDGRVLMELRKLFPQIELYGINKEKNHEFYRRESFILTGMKYSLFTKQEIEDVELPYILFQDLDFGAKIPYAENKFDVIFSQNVLSKIKYKFEVMNEMMRVLRPGGIGIHTDLSGVNIYAKGIVLELRDAIAEIRKRGIDIKLLEDKKSFRFKKPNMNALFPVTPHQPIPENINALPQELRRPEMGYNLNY